MVVGDQRRSCGARGSHGGRALNRCKRKYHKREEESALGAIQESAITNDETPLMNGLTLIIMIFGWRLMLIGLETLANIKK